MINHYKNISTEAGNPNFKTVHDDVNWDEAETSEEHNDWRNYVPESVREAWNQINTTGQIAIYLIAKTLAERARKKQS